MLFKIILNVLHPHHRAATHGPGTAGVISLLRRVLGASVAAKVKLVRDTTTNGQVFEKFVLVENARD